mmetsp:Transcript_21547/g.50153  ORF Transcript_21547/g.50153 Transcript_21547/m.50153 type:complete len:146 (+) Transcript_21547:35-472(+)
MKVPKVKNKSPAPAQVSVLNLLPAGHAAAAGALRPGLTSAVAPLSKMEEKQARLEFQAERQKVLLRGTTSADQLVFKKRRTLGSPGQVGPRAALRFRPSDWSKRRLLCIAVCKGDARTCPLAKLPQGFLRHFLDNVFSFLAPRPR